MGAEDVKMNRVGLKSCLGVGRKYCNCLYVLGPKLLFRLFLITSDYLFLVI